MIPPVQRKPKEWVLAKPEPTPKAARKTKAKKTAVVAEPEVAQTDEPDKVTKPTESDKAESESKESGDAGSE
jgi:hypothetical protein